MVLTDIKNISLNFLNGVPNSNPLLLSFASMLLHVRSVLYLNWDLPGMMRSWHFRHAGETFLTHG